MRIKIKNRMIKGALRGIAAVVVSMALAVAPIGVAHADDTSTEASNTSVVGKLSIVASYHADLQNFTDGHSFLVFTSYEDGVELDFTDLYGYYTASEDFAAAAEADPTLYSYKSNFAVVAGELYPGLTEEAYKALTAEEKAAQYPGLDAAIDAYADSCYVETLGTTQSDAKYKKTACSCLLERGDFITIGNYADSADMQMMEDMLTNSSLKDEFIAALKNNLQAGYTTDEIIENLTNYLKAYLEGEKTGDQVKSDIAEYLIKAIGQSGYDVFSKMFYDKVNLIDGDTTGGLFVNKELMRQKTWQDFMPNEVYSIDITEAQLEDLMTYLNSGDANHYSVAAHNCSTVAAAGWNAAVGYVRDATGANTSEHSALYMNEKDPNVSLFADLISTPRQVFSTIATWGTQDLGGTEESWTIIHGVDVPKAKHEKPTKETDATTDTTATSTTTTSSSATAQTGDTAPIAYVALAGVLAAGALIVCRKRTSK